MNNLDTAALCARQGICFKPLVTESTGAWDAEVRIFLELKAPPKSHHVTLLDLCSAK